MIIALDFFSNSLHFIADGDYVDGYIKLITIRKRNMDTYALCAA